MNGGCSPGSDCVLQEVFRREGRKQSAELWASCFHWCLSDRSSPHLLWFHLQNGGQVQVLEGPEGCVREISCECVCAYAHMDMRVCECLCVPVPVLWLRLQIFQWSLPLRLPILSVSPLENKQLNECMLFMLCALQWIWSKWMGHRHCKVSAQKKPKYYDWNWHWAVSRYFGIPGHLEILQEYLFQQVSPCFPSNFHIGDPVYSRTIPEFTVHDGWCSFAQIRSAL